MAVVYENRDGRATVKREIAFANAPQTQPRSGSVERDVAVAVATDTRSQWFGIG
jgi:hypothetical protein